MAKILVVDDEMGIRELLSEILDDEGHEIVLAENATVARRAYSQHSLDLILLDIWMPDTDGMNLLREWVQLAPLKCPIIMMSGHASIDTALEAQILGAADFLEKPITMHKLLASVHKALARAAKDVAPTVADDALVSELSSDAPASLGAVNTPKTLTITADVLDEWQLKLSKVPLDGTLRDLRDAADHIYFTYMLEREHWVMTKVAEACGLERTHLYRKLKQLNIEVNRPVGGKAAAANSANAANTANNSAASKG